MTMVDNFVYGLNSILEHNFNHELNIKNEIGLIVFLSGFTVALLMLRHFVNVVLMNKAFSDHEFLDKEVAVNWILVILLCIISVLIGSINYYDNLNIFAGVYLVFLLYNLVFYIDGYKFIMRVVNIIIVLIGTFGGFNLASYVLINGFSFNEYLFYIFPLIFVVFLEKTTYSVINNIDKQKKTKEKNRSSEYIEIQELLVAFKKMCSIDNLKEVSYQIGEQSVVEKLSVFLNNFFEDKKCINYPLNETQENRRRVLSKNIQIIKKYHNEFIDEIKRIDALNREKILREKILNSSLRDLLENYPAALYEFIEKKFGLFDIDAISYNEKEQIFKQKEKIIDRGLVIERNILDLINNYTTGYNHFVESQKNKELLKDKGLLDSKIISNIDLIKETDKDLNVFKSFSINCLKIYEIPNNLEDVFNEHGYNPKWSLIRYISKLPKEIEEIISKYRLNNPRSYIPYYYLYPYKFNDQKINYRGIKNNNERLLDHQNKYLLFDKSTILNIRSLLDSILQHTHIFSKLKISFSLVFKDDQITFNNLFIEVERDLVSLYTRMNIISINRNDTEFDKVNGNIIKHLNKTPKYDQKDVYIIISLKDDPDYRKSIINYCSENNTPKFVIIDLYCELGKNDVEKLYTLSTFLELDKLEQEKLNRIREKEENEKRIARKEEERQERQRIEILKEQERLKVERLREEEREKERRKAQILKEQENIKNELTQNEENKWKVESDNLLRKVSGLPYLSSSVGSSVRYFFFHEYYPTSETVVTQFDWDVRKTIWNFKDGNIISREIVISKVSSKLNEIFTKVELSNLVFICAPASSRDKNEKRFKEFSESLCKKTGMINGYNKIIIKKDRTPNHISSSVDNPLNYISFDEKFFNKKRVVIFDDVVTRGRTMCLISEKLESMGARPLLAISIGKTTHKGS